MALVTLVGGTMSRLPMTFSGSCPVRLKVSRTSTSYRAKVSACGLSTSSKRASRICCTRKTDVAARIAAAGPNRCSHVSPARSIGSNGSPSARTMRGTLPPGSRPTAEMPPSGWHGRPRVRRSRRPVAVAVAEVQLVAGHGAGEQVALGVLAPEFGQPVADPAALHPLGDDVHAERVGQLDRRVDDRRGPGLGVQGGDEGSVELQPADVVQVAQVAQRV